MHRNTCTNDTTTAFGPAIQCRPPPHNTRGILIPMASPTPLLLPMRIQSVFEQPALAPTRLSRTLGNSFQSPNLKSRNIIWIIVTVSAENSFQDASVFNEYTPSNALSLINHNTRLYWRPRTQHAAPVENVECKIVTYNTQEKRGHTSWTLY